jgi:hypothetical protein
MVPSASVRDADMSCTLIRPPGEIWLAVAVSHGGGSLAHAIGAVSDERATVRVDLEYATVTGPEPCEGRKPVTGGTGRSRRRVNRSTSPVRDSLLCQCPVIEPIGERGRVSCLSPERQTGGRML